MSDNVCLILVTIMVCFYILANVIDVFVLERRLNKQAKVFQENYDKEIREEERKNTIDEMESRILGNCSVMHKDSERVVVIRFDIFKFIVEQMKGGAEE